MLKFILDIIREDTKSFVFEMVACSFLAIMFFAAAVLLVCAA